MFEKYRIFMKEGIAADLYSLDSYSAGDKIKNPINKIDGILLKVVEMITSFLAMTLFQWSCKPDRI